METIKVDILNPKAQKLIEDLADLDLIAIRDAPSHNFTDLLTRMRSHSGAAPSPEEIAHEVEIVRSEQRAR